MLLNSYDYLVDSMRCIIDELEKKSTAVFRKEQSEQSGDMRLTAVGRAGETVTISGVLVIGFTQDSRGE